jgi:hypothetical protein
MELAGLEPATSWVRYLRSPAEKFGLFSRFLAESGPSPNIFPNTPQAVLQ